MQQNLQLQREYREEVDRAGRGAGWGLMATSVMTLLMAVGIIPGAPAALRPFPVVLVHHALPMLGPLALTVVTVLLHFAYGGLAGVIFAYLARPMSVGRGLAYGLGLWLVMEVTFVPWGFGTVEFGLGRGDPWSALFNLVLHLAYGGSLGWFGARDERWHHVMFDGADRLRVA